MAIARQKAAVRIKKAAKAAKRTLAHLPRTVENARGAEKGSRHGANPARAAAID